MDREAIEYINKSIEFHKKRVSFLREKLQKNSSAKLRQYILGAIHAHDSTARDLSESLW